MLDTVDTVRSQLLYLFHHAAAPPHVVDHLSDALGELQLLDDPAAGVLLPVRPAQEVGEELQALPGLRRELQAAIERSTGAARLLALGRAGRCLALAEQDLAGRPCSMLRATRDELGAAAELRR